MGSGVVRAMKELCIRCGRPTPYDIHTPVTSRLYYIEGSGQLCEQCFSLLYSSSSAFSTTPTQREQGKLEGQETGEQETNIKTITLKKGRTPTQADQERYNQLINKPSLSDTDREELARLYKKYTD